MKWTTQQANAINLRNSNLLVSAAAGSGKTAVITQRAIEIIIKEKVDVSKILMLTFTNAAASEMRTRLAGELLKHINSSDEDVGYLSLMLEKINESDISTIHAYCISLLRRNYHSANIDPNFSIMGDEQSDYLSRAMEESLDLFYDRGDKDFKVLCDTLGGRGGSKISDIALSLYQFARSQPEYMAKINLWTENYNQEHDELFSGLWVQFLLSNIKNQLRDAMILIENALEIARKEIGPITYEAALLDDQRHVKALYDNIINKDIDDMKVNINNHVFMKLGRKKKEDDIALVEMCKSLRNCEKALINKLSVCSIFRSSDDIIHEHKAMYKPLSSLRELLIDFDARYTRMKKRQSLMDFSDLQHYALLALDDDKVAQSERKRYDYIFLDEYQDTNLLQESLVEKIVSKRNFLCVGDVKQSIYAFRQADPELFLQRRDKCKNVDDKDNTLISLNQNFRSSPAIIDCCNLVFDTVMSTRLGGVKYDEDERLYHGAPRPNNEDKGSVELVIIDESDKDISNSNSSIEREATIAAQKVKEILGKKIWDGKKKIYRPATPSDICILTKSFRPIVRDVRRVFEQYGIPILPQESGEYFDEIEVAQLQDILTIIDNKHRDTSLISAMASPAFGFAMDELLTIRQAYKSDAYTFCQAILEYSKLESPLGNRIFEFLERLNRYNDLSRYLPLKDFIWQLLDETGFYNAVGALPGGSVRQGNLQLLIDRANTYSKQPSATLHGYLSFMERLKNYNASISSADAPAGDAVKFMSIHHSKGLEYPIVIMIASGKKVNMQSSSQSVSTFKNLGYGCDYYENKKRLKTKTLAKEALSTAISQSMYSEDMRVFYVALTRAREKLLVIGSTKTSVDKLCESWAMPFLPSQYMSTKATYLNYMGVAAMRNLYCNNIISRVDYPPESIGRIENFNVEILNADDIHVNTTRHAGAVAKAMMDCKKNSPIREFLNIEDTQSSHIPNKTSATALISGYSPGTIYIPEIMPVPEFTVEQAFTPAQRGTITHQVLEQIPLDCNDIDGFVESLIKRRIIPDNAWDAIHVQWIKEFLDSDIANRAKRSNQLRREVPFVIKKSVCEIFKDIDSKDDMLIQGIIDMCFIENDKWIIVDYKTNRVSKNNTAKMILEHYTPQLSIYSQAIELITGMKVSAVGLYLLSVSDCVWL